MGQAHARCANVSFQDAGCVPCTLEDSCTAEVARHMLEAEAPFTKEDSANCMLLRASQDGDLDAIHKAMAEGANPNTRLPMWIRIGGTTDEDPPSEIIQSDHSASSLTPLMLAAQGDHAEAVELLLRLGAAVDLREADGMQALHFAAESASVDCFRMLLGAGANPVATDNHGRDALQCVPLSQVAVSPSKREWLQLFKEATCWSTPVHETTRLQPAPPNVSACEARPDDEANEPDTIATMGVEDAMQTALTCDAEDNGEEASVSSQKSVVLINEMNGLHEADRKLHAADRKLSDCSEASTASDLHFEV